jgi:hypothetical protein
MGSLGLGLGLTFGRRGFSPLSLGPALWLDAAESYSDAGVTPAVNGGTVQQVNDISGFARHASQATLARRPTFLASGIGGQPALDLDGTDDFLASTMPVLIGPLTAFVVMRAAADATLRLAADIGGAGVGGLMVFSSYSSTQGCSVQYGTGSSVVVLPIPRATTNNVLGILTFRAAAGGATVLRWNGAAIATGTGAAITTYSTLWVGSQGGTQRYTFGQVGSLILFPAGLTDSQVSQVEASLAGKYGVALP